MKVEGLDRQLSNLNDFRQNVKKYGFSINNFYDVRFEIAPNSPLYREIIKEPELNRKVTDSLMTLYTDEAVIPGVQISTGEYRINNSPTLKYGYGAVFSEASFSFIMDADAKIKSIFDIWTNWIYGYSSRVTQIGPLLQQVTPRLRTRYRDDYSVDIVIIKYERAMSSALNGPKIGSNNSQPSFTIKEIIPDTLKNEPSKFYKAVPTYAVRLFKAFPSNVSSVTLNSGTSELTKLSVTFEYETMTSSVLNNGSINSAIDPINGGNQVGEELIAAARAIFNA